MPWGFELSRVICDYLFSRFLHFPQGRYDRRTCYPCRWNIQDGEHPLGIFPFQFYRLKQQDMDVIDCSENQSECYLPYMTSDNLRFPGGGGGGRASNNLPFPGGGGRENVTKSQSESEPIGILLTIQKPVTTCVSGGRGYSAKHKSGRLRPKVQTLTLLYTIFDGKGTPSSKENCAPFLNLQIERLLINFSLG